MRRSFVFCIFYQYRRAICIPCGSRRHLCMLFARLPRLTIPTINGISLAQSTCAQSHTKGLSHSLDSHLATCLSQYNTFGGTLTTPTDSPPSLDDCMISYDGFLKQHPLSSNYCLYDGIDASFVAQMIPPQQKQFARELRWVLIVIHSRSPPPLPMSHPTTGVFSCLDRGHPLE